LPDPNAEPVANDSVGADLSAAWDQAQEGTTTEAPAPADPASPSEVPATSSPPSEAAGGDAGRARDDQGRFTKAEKAAQAQAAQAAEFKVPEKWPAEVRAELEAIHKANPAHAEFVMKQYAHFRGEASRWAQTQEKRFEKLSNAQKQVDDLLAPGRQARALKGIDDTSYIRNLVAAGDFLDRNPKEGIKYLCKQYGLDPATLAAATDGAPEIPAPVREMQERLQMHEAALRAMTQEAQHSRLAEAGDWVNRFASQRDGQGQSLYPYFDRVLPEIITLVQHQMGNGQQVDVHAAYKTAIRMNDQVWLEEQSRTNDASRKEAESKRLRDIEEAKRAGFSLSGSGGASDAPMENLRDELSRQYDKFIS
jgi:hypothetical protein